MPPASTIAPLNEASGSVNAVAIVKYFRQPERTRGSGFSLFLSISDPSLRGGKMSCIIFDDVKDKLPNPNVGDVIVLRRLVVKEFRGQNQACGYGTTGFRYAVFSSAPTAPLSPISSTCKSEHHHPTPVQFTREELDAVTSLRVWFHSPSCPVERELDPTVAITPLEHGGLAQAPSAASICRPRFPYRRLTELCFNEYINLDAQVVAIYPFPLSDQCVILYIWDGSFATVDSSPAFYAPRRRHLYSILPSSWIHPHLAALTRHNCRMRKRRTVVDWSVPVFVYDEHALAVRQSLRAGNLIRLTNLHVTRCRSTECKRPDCFRLIIHGGGSEKWSRRVALLDEGAAAQSSQLSNPALLASLNQAAIQRPFYLTSHFPANSSLPPILIGQACAIPSLVHQQESQKAFVKSSPIPSQVSRFLNIVNPVNWIPVSCSSTSGNLDRSLVRIRLVGRVTSVYPRTPSQLIDSIIIKCNTCQAAVRLSSLLDSSICSCKQQATYSVLPFFLIKLIDPSGVAVIAVTGQTALNLLDILAHPSIDRCLLASPTWWVNLMSAKLVNPLRPSGGWSQMIGLLRRLKNKSIDVLVDMSWQPDWDYILPVVPKEMEICFHLADTGWIRHC